MDGMIFNIQKFCINDGPGIRTSVFLKGCPLRCVWCHNPESQKGLREVLAHSEKCTGCGRCNGVDLLNEDFVCYNGAREICGRSISADEVVRSVMRDAVFYKNSGGGVTLTGGEPLAQGDFAVEVLKKCKENGISTAVETCGYASAQLMQRIAQYTDLFLYDYKETDSEKHRAFTGVTSELILENLRLIDSLGKQIILRCPIVPGYNMRTDHYDGIARVANATANVRAIEIEPYHRLGEGKYDSLGIEGIKIQPPTDEEVEKIIEYISALTEKPVRKS